MCVLHTDQGARQHAHHPFSLTQYHPQSRFCWLPGLAPWTHVTAACLVVGGGRILSASRNILKVGVNSVVTQKKISLFQLYLFFFNWLLNYVRLCWVLVTLLQPRVPRNKLTQKDNADRGVQLITQAGPRQSLLLAKDPDQFL